ncbi:MAG: ABC transporter ATP-binding protein [Bacilli bacterium]|nr:ABC transporter ATP-binding protein [Bacilli bacterium]MDD2681548.1 ABC transporter ATP-binding protein [Bacilli bacterium]MDD3121185.1 ABC transporter ATP-binding protein [Bacilli bacterium]MDD4482571.1 ABC transporter ATP-binding protein [Bacilli bacterium]
MEEKAHIVKEFIYAVKEVASIDKLFIYQKILYAILSSVNSFAYAYVIRVAVSAIEQNKPIEIFIRDVLIVSGIAFLISFGRKMLDQTFWYKSDRIATILKQQKSIRTLEMDYELLERPETQDAAEKATRRINAWNGVMGLVNNGFMLIEHFLMFIIASAIVISVNWLLIIAILVLALFKVLFENKNQKREKHEFYDKTPPMWRRIGYTNNIASTLTIGKDLRIYAMDEFISQERNDATGEYLKIAIKNRKKTIINSILINFITFFDTLLLYGFMIYEVIYNDMKIATFTFMVSSVYTLTNALHIVIRQNAHVLRNSLETKDYRNFMSIEYVREQENQTIEADHIEVEFKNVYYSYYMQEGYALEDVSFKIKKGEKIALVGYNGAGKTTLVKLLGGLYHPTKGQILINGIDIETLERESLQKLISLVFQENIMYALEIAENIAMATTENVDYEKVADIVKLIELNKKVESLPNKIKTHITRELDETAIELSGGETQLVALARAMYKNAPLYVLDEPTSAMDALNEVHMYRSFNDIIRGNTAIFISHRLSSTKFCDRIIFINEGKIIETGTHHELMERDGEYKKMFSMQSNYYKEATNEETQNN